MVTSKLLTFAVALVGQALLANAAPWVPSIYACANKLVKDATNWPLVYTTFYSQYHECRYLKDNGDGSSSETYCWYDYRNHTLYHYPNTPIPIDSDAACPPKTPSSTGKRYLIKTSQSGKCVTRSGGKNGSRVVIQDCDYRHGNPGQVWAFTGSHIKDPSANMCLDVKDGNAANGARLQIWDCGPGYYANQQFQHWVSDFLIIPEDHIKWMLKPWMCLDLKDGNLANGTPIQTWQCYYPNPNQKWYIEPLL